MESRKGRKLGGTRKRGEPEFASSGGNITPLCITRKTVGNPGKTHPGIGKGREESVQRRRENFPLPGTATGKTNLNWD